MKLLSIFIYSIRDITTQNVLFSLYKRNLLIINFPPKSTAWDCSSLWSRDGVLDHIGRVLQESIRIHANRDAAPSAGIIDSQNVKTTQASEAVGYDAGKKTQGRKRHMVVDILGLLLGVKDYEYSTRSSEAWVKITSINMMIHRLEPG